ncbi:MAG: hypothetical protein WCV99_21060, partial [Sterolibacterium sp.]
MSTTDIALASAAVPAARESMLRLFAEQFVASKLAMLGLVLLLLFLCLAIFAPWIAPQNPFDIATLNIMDSKLPPGSHSSSGA